MRNQLALIEPDFRLDEQTKALGRRGVAAARAVLHSVAADDAAGASDGPAGTAGSAGSGDDSARDAAFAAGGRAMAQAERTPAA